MPSPDELHVDFRFVRKTDPSDHRVPANVLAAAMEHAQRAFFLIGMEVEGLEVRQRARIPDRIAERYVLAFEPPREGSYQQMGVLDGTDAAVDLFGSAGASQMRETALNRFKQVSTHLSDGQPEKVREVLPDRNLRLRVLDEFAEMLPREADGWGLELSNGTGDFARFTYEGLQTVRSYVRQQLIPQDRVAHPVTVGGRLVSLDFERRAFVIRVGPNNKALSCSYADEAEALLIENPRDYVRVTGEAVRSDDGQVEEMVNVFDIEDLDLSPFVLDVVALPDGSLLRFTEGPRTFEVALDSSGELLLVRDDAFGTDIAATSRQDLHEMLLDEIDLLWNDYALADDTELTTDAQVLKRAALAHLTPVTHAA